MIRSYYLLALVLVLGSCNTSSSQTTTKQKKQGIIRTTDPDPDYSSYKTPSIQESGLDKHFPNATKAIFAGGCFWCIEEVFERVNGVEGAYSGYVGGTKEHPDYYGVGAGGTDYTEAVLLYYDPKVVTYEQLLEFFYFSHHPTQLNGQGPDRGRQYRAGVFYLNDKQKDAATAYQTKLDKSGTYHKPIVTEITKAGVFYLAEDYHQDYYPQHPENPYVQRVSKPKADKFSAAYSQFLKKDRP